MVVWIANIMFTELELVVLVFGICKVAWADGEKPRDRQTDRLIRECVDEFLYGSTLTNLCLLWCHFILPWLLTEGELKCRSCCSRHV